MYQVRYTIILKQILKYQLPNGKIPFDEWLIGLDKAKKAEVLIRLERCKIGLLGQHRNLTNGITELKFHSGERIYICEKNDVIIILLNAGNKQRQSVDIAKAIKYIQDYNERFVKND